MNVEVFADDESAARAAAKMIAEEARAAVAARARFVMAVSGGHTPWIMLRALGDEELPWERVHVVQVDERVAPAGHPDSVLVIRAEEDWAIARACWEFAPVSTAPQMRTAKGRQ